MGNYRLRLALAIAVPFSGWLMNQFNGKKVFILAMIAFGFTSILAGVSWNITVFNIFRILQGFSAGIITTLMFTLLVKTAGQDHIGKVMAVVSTPMIFGPILGPVLEDLLFILQTGDGYFLLIFLSLSLQYR